jgi:phospholipase A-2-activating protein
MFRVTDSFLYSINMVHSSSNECLFITSGEDRTLRVHSSSKSSSDFDSSGCIQSIALPCQTLWYTVCLPNGNIAVACSDGSIRLFTQKENLMATKSEQEEYETELSKFAIPLKSNAAMSQIDRTQLPSIEALAIPGKKGKLVKINY